jgi:hypothetical protein
MDGTMKTIMIIAIGTTIASLVTLESVRAQVVTFPGIGRADLSELPPNARTNIRIPGESYDEPENEYGNLPPLPNAGSADGATQGGSVPSGAAGENAEESSGGVQADGQAGAANSGVLRSDKAQPKEDRRLEAAVRHMHDERAFPNATIPEGAYDRAWEEFKRLPPAPPAPPGEAVEQRLPEPEALWERAKQWLLARVSSSSVNAQPPLLLRQLHRPGH